MDIDFDPSTALYGIAAFLGAITVFYFGSSLIFDLSPVTKSLALLLSSGIFLAVSLYLSERNRIHSLISIGMTGISYLAFLVYTLGKFEFSREEIFVSLFLSSLLFVALGYLKNQGRLEIGKGQVKYLFAAVVCVGGALLVVDILGSQPTYSVDLKDDVRLEPGREAVIGSLTVKNDFFLPRELSEPSFSSCTGQGQRERGLYVDVDTGNLVSGKSQDSYNITVNAPSTRFMNNSATFELEETDSCPEERINGTLYIFRTSGSDTVEYID